MLSMKTNNGLLSISLYLAEVHIMWSVTFLSSTKVNDKLTEILNFYDEVLQL